jgi:hypothetical protein
MKAVCVCVCVCVCVFVLRMHVYTTCSVRGFIRACIYTTYIHTQIYKYEHEHACIHMGDDNALENLIDMQDLLVVLNLLSSASEQHKHPLDATLRTA